MEKATRVGHFEKKKERERERKGEGERKGERKRGREREREKEKEERRGEKGGKKRMGRRRKAEEVLTVNNAPFLGKQIHFLRKMELPTRIQQPEPPFRRLERSLL